MLPGIERQYKNGKEVVFRADAAFAKPEMYEALEHRGVKYAIRLPANDNLERDIEELLTQPVGRLGHRPMVRYRGRGVRKIPIGPPELGVWASGNP